MILINKKANIIHEYITNRKNIKWTKSDSQWAQRLTPWIMHTAFFLQNKYFVNIAIISETPQVNTIIQVWRDKGIVKGQMGNCVKNFYWLY